jgi:hypothetical protein
MNSPQGFAKALLKRRKGRPEITLGLPITAQQSPSRHRNFVIP